MDSSTSRLLARLAVYATIYTAGVVSLSTVDTTAGPAMPVRVALYHSLRFFTIDAPGFPEGGPPLAVVAFLAVMFLAPAAVAETLLEGWHAVYRAAGPRPWRLSELRDPLVIVGGYGLHGRAVAEGLAAAGCTVVVVDPEALDGDTGTVLLAGRPAPFVRGDFTLPEALTRAGVARASAVWFCAGDATANLRGAVVASRLSGPAHRELIPLVDEAIDAELIAGGAGLGRVFPLAQFESAAIALVSDPATRRALDARRDRGGRVALVGFGRFGRAICSQLERAWAGASGRLEVVLVDRVAQRKLTTWRASCSLPCVAVDADASEWEWAPEAAPDVVFVCTSEDLTNLRLAARVRRTAPNATVVLRLFDTALADARSAEGVVTRSLHALLVDSVRARAASRRP